MRDAGKGFDDFLIDTTGDSASQNHKPPPWQILVVDDCSDVIAVTNAVLRDCTFEGRSISILTAGSGIEARRVLADHPDIAVALIDVVMETDDAGLQLINTIRNEMQLRAMRIILRTGQPGHAPEREVIFRYDINDYRLKTELTAHSLFTAVVAALRGFAEITARIQAEQEALLAARSKSQFLAAISHELRTPLNAIIGFSEIVAHESRASGATEKSLEYIDAIQDNGNILLSVINNLIDMASIDSGHYQLKEQIIVIKDLLSRAISTLTDKPNLTGVTLTYKPNENLPMILADSAALSQVLENLISNAIKFSPQGGAIEVSAQIDDDGRLAIAVADHGIGIPANRVQSLFQPFTQVDAEHNRQFEGVGLGLAIVKGLIALHGGTIGVASVEGEGTTMTFYLPTERFLPASNSTSRFIN